MEEKIRLSDLREVKGIGSKTIDRIRNSLLHKEKIREEREVSLEVEELETNKIHCGDNIKRVYDPSYKSPTLTGCTGGNHQKKVLQEGKPRKLTPVEYERLQTVPDGYTEAVSNTRRYDMLGSGFTVDVICHLLKPLKGVI